MKNKVKNVISLLLTVIFVSMPILTFAETGANNDSIELPDDYIVVEESLTVKNSKGMLVQVDIEADAQGKLTLAEVREIADSVMNKNKRITIHEVGGERDSDSDVILLSLNLFDLQIEPAASANQGAADYFITSVARGQTIPAGEKFSAYYALDVLDSFEALSGVNNFFIRLQIGLQTSFFTRLSMNPDKRFSGPDENSPYNSREYRVKFYHRYRDFSITVKGECYAGQFWEPRHYALYSIDSYVN